jgi:hypothetical protein
MVDAMIRGGSVRRGSQLNIERTSLPPNTYIGPLDHVLSTMWFIFGQPKSDNNE